MSEEQESKMGKQAWQSQTLDAPPISLEFIHFQVAKLNSSWRREMHLVYWAVAIGVVTALYALFRSVEAGEMRYVIRAGVVLVMLGMLAVAFLTRRYAGQIALQSQESVTRSLDAYRSELLRLRDYYLHHWRWSLWPLMPGICVIVIGGIVFDTRPNSWIRYSSMIASCCVGVLIAIWDQRRKAMAFERELNALSSLEQPKS
jgi:hypothetical protein